MSKRRFGMQRKGQQGNASITYTETQASLVRLYSDENHKPRLGVSNAHGPMNVGDIKKIPGGLIQEAVDAPFTSYLIAQHLGYTRERSVFMDRVINVGVGVPELIVGDLNRGAKAACRNDIERVRQIFAQRGFEGVKCYLYFAWRMQYTTHPETGEIVFERSPEQYLSLVPIEPKEAIRRFQIPDQLAYELALTAAFIVKKRLRIRTIEITEQRLLRGFENAMDTKLYGIGEWFDFLSKPLLQAVIHENETADDDAEY